MKLLIFVALCEFQIIFYFLKFVFYSEVLQACWVEQMLKSVGWQQDKVNFQWELLRLANVMGVNCTSADWRGITTWLLDSWTLATMLASQVFQTKICGTEITTLQSEQHSTGLPTWILAQESLEMRFMLVSPQIVRQHMSAEFQLVVNNSQEMPVCIIMLTDASFPLTIDRFSLTHTAFLLIHPEQHNC